ncbi:MAG TPA: alpha/beta hydrolase [Rhizomicrobium sp.]|nr:alpha/beta hydrolase [Rhizomicrobium sp.]
MDGIAAIARKASAAYVLLLLSACTLSDSLQHNSIYSVWTPGRQITRTVVFATDREPDARPEFAPLGYGLHWDARMHCGRVTLTAKKYDPNFLPDGPPADIACDSDMGGFAHALIDSAPANCKRALLYVHGYNQIFRSDILRAGQIAADTQWPCAAGAFSWSSEGKFDRYAADIERSGYSVPELAALLRATSAAGITVDVVAHSMGTRVVLSALSGLEHSCIQTGSRFIGELILAAPDVSSEKYNDDFGHLLARAAACVRRITIYASAGDMVLIGSESIHGGVPRAGRNPEADLAYANPGPDHVVDVVDATLAPGDAIGHGYFVQSYEMLTDMMWVLAGEPIALRARKTPRHEATLFCYETETHPCNPAEGRFALHVAKERRPDWFIRTMRSLVPITSPFQ